jgi:hypothetical protein
LIGVADKAIRFLQIETHFRPGASLTPEIDHAQVDCLTIDLSALDHFLHTEVPVKLDLPPKDFSLAEY